MLLPLPELDHDAIFQSVQSLLYSEERYGKDPYVCFTVFLIPPGKAESLCTSYSQCIQRHCLWGSAVNCLATGKP